MKTVKKIYIKKFLPNKNVKIKETAEGLILRNKTNRTQKIIAAKGFLRNSEFIRIDFSGRVLSGSSDIKLKLFNLRKDFSAPAMINAKNIVKKLTGRKTEKNYVVIFLPAHTEAYIDNICLTNQVDNQVAEDGDYCGDVLVITPMYPSEAKPYAATFVDSKVQQYKKHNIKVDVVTVSNFNTEVYRYKYNGVTINKMSYNELRHIIRKNKYKKILIHFLDYEIGNTILSCDTDDTQILVYCHGADVDLWNQDIFCPYFSEKISFTSDEVLEKEKRREMLQKFDEMDNVKWIFNTEWNLNNAKKATGISFKNNEIIPCVIDRERFKFSKRNAEDRLKILIIKKMDDIKQYAVDIAVRTIIKLAKKPYFNELTFTIIGAGDAQNRLTAPLRKYKNINIIDGFYQNSEMNNIFQENGILFAPTRYDTQGVTAGEAAMSGMAVITSKNTGFSDVIPEKKGLFFDNSNIEDAVGIFDKIYEDPGFFEASCERIHDSVVNFATVEKIEKEIELIRSDYKGTNRLLQKKAMLKDLKKQPVLSIVIPSYNAAAYLPNAIKSLVNQKHFNWLEIIVVNDGSKDNTDKVMKEIIKTASDDVKKVIRYINKENGGHGSTINYGLRIATGKYFRVMDADDRMDSKSLEHHLETLANAKTDIVFTNTIHDMSETGKLIEDNKYPFMNPMEEYVFDELCIPEYGFPGYGTVLSTVSILTDKIRQTGCTLTEKSFYVDIEYNYYMTEAATTAMLDPVHLYYYCLGGTTQSLSNESYKRNFLQHLKVMDETMSLLEQGKLSNEKYDHFVRIQLHETVAHQYRIALDMFNDYKKYKIVEKVIKKHKIFCNDKELIPGAVQRIRKFGYPYFVARKMYINIRPKLATIKHLIK